MCFTPIEAREIDQYIQDSKVKAANYSAAIIARDSQIHSLKDYAARTDSAYSDCRLRAAMLGDAHTQDRINNAQLTKKVQRRGDTTKGLAVLSVLLIIILAVR